MTAINDPHPCIHGCGTMLHPFDDTHRGEPRVYWREEDGTTHVTVECWAMLGERVARLTAERDGWRDDAHTLDKARQQATAERDEARRFGNAAKRGMEMVCDRARTIADEANGPHPLLDDDAAFSEIERALFDLRMEAATAISRLRRVRGVRWEVRSLRFGKPDTYIYCIRRAAFLGRRWRRADTAFADVRIVKVTTFAKARG